MFGRQGDDNSDLAIGKAGNLRKTLGKALEKHLTRLEPNTFGRQGDGVSDLAIGKGGNGRATAIRV